MTALVVVACKGRATIKGAGVSVLHPSARGEPRPDRSWSPDCERKAVRPGVSDALTQISYR